MRVRPRPIDVAWVCVPALVVVLAACSIAAWPADAADESGPELIEALRAKGAQIVTLGSRGGLDGYFVTPAGSAGYSLYVTGDGHAIAGLLYDPYGTEITGAQLAAVHDGGAFTRATGGGARRDVGTAVTAHAEPAEPGAPSSAASRVSLFERSAAAFGFTLGEHGPVVVLLGDALCPWSRSAAAKLGRKALAGRLQLHVVPVAVLGADAARRAAAIAAHPDPARAWFERPDGPADRLGGERIAHNNALLDEWGADAVPLIAWRGPGGVAHRIGDIDDMDAWLRETLVPETLVPGTLRVGDPRAGHPWVGDGL